MGMDSFSYKDAVRAAFASCLPCFAPSHPPNSSLTVTETAQSADLEHLLRDTDSDALSLHSNLGGAPAHRRAKHRRRPKFSLTLFGYTLLGRPPIYLTDDEEEEDVSRARTLPTTSSSTLDSDAAPLDASTIERMTSPDHYAALAAQREHERQRLEVEEAARRKAERRARRQERKVRARAEALMSLNAASPLSDMDTFEGFQGNGESIVPTSFPSYQVVPDHPDLNRYSREGGFNSGDADDADLGGELYTQKKKSPVALSASGSDSRSRTSASFSGGDASHTHTTHPSMPYPQTEMHLPVPAKKSHRTPKRTSTISSATSQSTSIVPYTPVEGIVETPAVAASPVPPERYIRSGERTDFPSAGLSGKRKPHSLSPKTFLAYQG